MADTTRCRGIKYRAQGPHQKSDIEIETLSQPCSETENKLNGSIKKAL